MSFAAETTVTVPSGATQIGELRAGDLVLATNGSGEWQQYEIKLAESAAGMTAVIVLELQGEKSLIVTPDQPFLVQGKFRRADELTPMDTLVGGGGQPIRIMNAVVADYADEMCDIATSSTEPVNGHLIEANGVIAGDYDLQVAIGS